MRPTLKLFFLFFLFFGGAGTCFANCLPRYEEALRQQSHLSMKFGTGKALSKTLKALRLVEKVMKPQWDSLLKPGKDLLKFSIQERALSNLSLKELQNLRKFYQNFSGKGQPDSAEKFLEGLKNIYLAGKLGLLCPREHGQLRLFTREDIKNEYPSLVKTLAEKITHFEKAAMRKFADQLAQGDRQATIEIGIIKRSKAIERQLLQEKEGPPVLLNFLTAADREFKAFQENQAAEMSWKGSKEYLVKATEDYAKAESQHLHPAIARKKGELVEKYRNELSLAEENSKKQREHLAKRIQEFAQAKASLEDILPKNSIQSETENLKSLFQADTDWKKEQEIFRKGQEKAENRDKELLENENDPLEIKRIKLESANERHQAFGNLQGHWETYLSLKKEGLLAMNDFLSPISQRMEEWDKTLVELGAEFIQSHQQLAKGSEETRDKTSQAIQVLAFSHHLQNRGQEVALLQQNLVELNNQTISVADRLVNLHSQQGEGVLREEFVQHLEKLRERLMGIKNSWFETQKKNTLELEAMIQENARLKDEVENLRKMAQDELYNLERETARIEEKEKGILSNLRNLLGQMNKAPPHELCRGEPIEPQGQELCCSLCQEDFAQNSITLPCGFQLCAPCMGKFLKEEHKARRLPLKCPHPECNDGLHLPAKTLALTKASPHLLHQIEKQTILHHIYKNNLMEPCPGQGCLNFTVFKEGSNPHFNCPYCKTQSCMKCKRPWHEDPCGETLKKIEMDDENMRQKGFMDCPYCLTWAERESGCTYLTCTKCSMPFDLRTGGPWTEKSDYATAHRDWAGPEQWARIKKDRKLIYDRGVISRYR